MLPSVLHFERTSRQFARNSDSTAPRSARGAEIPSQDARHCAARNRIRDWSIAAPPAAIWPFASDPGIPARFSAELQTAAFADDAEHGVGAVILGTNKNGAFTWTTESTVTDCDAPSLFRWATGEPGDPTATWSFAIASADGGATLTHSVVLHAGRLPLGPAVEAEPERAHEIVQTRLAIVLVNMSATASGIARLAEHA